jgi:hypothetical protein
MHRALAEHARRRREDWMKPAQQFLGVEEALEQRGTLVWVWSVIIISRIIHSCYNLFVSYLHPSSSSSPYIVHALYFVIGVQQYQSGSFKYATTEISIKMGSQKAGNVKLTDETIIVGESRFISRGIGDQERNLRGEQDSQEELLECVRLRCSSKIACSLRTQSCFRACSETRREPTRNIGFQCLRPRGQHFQKKARHLLDATLGWES